MIYLTGIQALNLPCKLDTCGDWHCSGLRWDVLNLRDTKDTLFGDYEIELNKTIPEHTEQYNVANHIRALLDLIEDGNFSAAQGMNNDFICNDAYNEEIFLWYINCAVKKIGIKFTILCTRNTKGAGDHG